MDKDAHANAAPALLPLTERALARLPGPRALWIAAWALVPWLNAGANLLLDTNRTSAVWEQSTALVVLNYAALSFGVAVSLWGTGRIARRLEELRATTPGAPFRGMNSVAGPIALSAAAGLAFGGATLASDGWLPALVRGGTWIVIGVALLGFLWTYACLLLGLDRLGRTHLVPRTLVVDPGLGLQPFGSLASTGLWMVLVWLVPVLLTGLPDVAGAVIGLVVLAAVLAAFFLSLFRLHRQMVGVKARELEVARELYAQAYEPVHEARTLEALDRQRGLLAAADALEKRASAIYEWPFQERTPTVVITIVTSVTAMAIGRLILDPFGL